MWINKSDDDPQTIDVGRQQPHDEHRKPFGEEQRSILPCLVSRTARQDFDVNRLARGVGYPEAYVTKRVGRWRGRGVRMRVISREPHIIID